VTLKPGEALVLIVRRGDVEPTKYFVAVRRSTSSFDQLSHDFKFDGVQEAVLELGEHFDLRVALDKAAEVFEKLQS
jgi:hypothetical protein